MNLFLAFLDASFVVLATPGPDTAITIRNTLLGGRMGGVFTALGISSGQTIWALATSAGIVALLVASEPLFVNRPAIGTLDRRAKGTLYRRTTVSGRRAEMVRVVKPGERGSRLAA